MTFSTTAANADNDDLRMSYVDMMLLGNMRGRISLPDFQNLRASVYKKSMPVLTFRWCNELSLVVQTLVIGCFQINIKDPPLYQALDLALIKILQKKKKKHRVFMLY